VLLLLIVAMDSQEKAVFIVVLQIVNVTKWLSYKIAKGTYKRYSNPGVFDVHFCHANIPLLPTSLQYCRY
jgi:hypothetical protein